jgi:hypothetical protein
MLPGDAFWPAEPPEFCALAIEMPATSAAIAVRVVIVFMVNFLA